MLVQLFKLSQVSSHENGKKEHTINWQTQKEPVKSSKNVECQGCDL